MKIFTSGVWMAVGVVVAMAAVAHADEPAAWVVADTRAVVDAPRMLVLEFAEPATDDAEFAVSIDPPNAVEILRPLRVRKGCRFAYVRVKPTQAGTATVSVPELGEALTIQLHAANAPDYESPVEVLTPKPGAVLWGEVTVAGRFEGVAPIAARVKLAGEVVAEIGGDAGAIENLDGVWRPTFTADAAKWPVGRAPLAVELVFGDGQTRTSEAVPVEVMHPALENVGENAGESASEFVPISREAEDLAALELPENFRPQRQPSIGNDRAASGGKFANHAGADPPTRIPVTGPKWVQMAVVARGQYAGGAWPTIGIWLDADRATLYGSTPTVSAKWHRVLVGAPVFVPEGEHWLAPRFMNDYYVRNVADRNLYIDRVELLPVPARDENFGNNVGITLLAPFDGKTVPGPLYLDSVVVRTKREIAPPPVFLELNGQRLDVQHSDRPRFRVGTDVMVAGANRLRLVADLGASGDVASQTVTFFWNPNPTEPAGLPDAFHRICAAEPGWEGAGVQDVGYFRGAPDGHVFAFNSAREVSRSLPAHLVGEFDMYVYAHGERFEGDPICRISIDGEPPLEKEIPPGWRSTHFGRVKLAATDENGEAVAHTLTMAFTNDKYTPNVGDRNLRIGAVEFRPVAPADRTPPAVVWHYPPEGATIARVDAVVVDVADANVLADATLLVDGQPLPGAFEPLYNAMDARICIPFALRNLAPGPHKLQMAVRDRANRITQTPEISVTLSENPADSPFAAAVHFLNRFGYGPEPRVLADVLLDGIENCLRRWLMAGPDADRIHDMNVRYPVMNSNGHAFQRVLQLGMQTGNPVRYRLTQFWENHFSTWIQKVGAEREWVEFRTLDRLAHHKFREILHASATSPAMLVYLDQDTSFAGRINENYAREIMELHTLGVRGGYTQTDVEQLSRVLTGWSATIDDFTYRFAFHAGLHDGGAVEVYGYAFAPLPANADALVKATLGRERGETALDLLVAHPATARFIAQKLVEHYVAVPAPAELVDVVAETFLQTEGDIVDMLVTIANHPRFASANPGEKGTDPLEFGLRFARCGNYGNGGWLYDMLNATERVPMDRVTPDGYPEAGAAWFDSSAMLQRWRFAELNATVMNRRLFLGGVRGRNVEADAAWNQALIDCLAVRFTGRLLSEKSNAVAMQILAGAEGNHDQRVGLAISILGQLPETQMN